MILLDFSQLAYASILEHLASVKETIASVDMCRHMVLNTIRVNVKKFKHDYGEVVVAYDDDQYWRRDVFPHYKARRKKDRENSVFNWESIFECMSVLREEFKKNLIYKVIQVPQAEADDIIGTLCGLRHHNKIMIVSGDKDFIQLQSNSNVYQWSPIVKKMLVDDFPMMTLKQQIIRGDRGDGIPNILSPDDVFVSGGRQKPIMSKKLIHWLNMKPEDFCDTGDMLRNFKRNEQLIDLKYIPSEIRSKVGTEYECASPPDRMRFMNYLSSSGCKELAKCVDDF